MDDQHDTSETSDDKKAKHFIPLDAMTKVVNKNGRWLVMLNVPTWEPGDNHHPVTNNWKTINDYSTEADAQVAASWIEKSANRQIRPPLGF